MKLNFIINSEIDDKKWDDFVDAHPQSNIFQTSSMFKVFQKTKGYRPFRFWAFDAKTQKVLGVLLGTLVREKEGLMGKFSTRAVIQGGPLVSNINPAIVNALIRAFDETVQRQAIWCEIWNMADTKETRLNIKNYGQVSLDAEISAENYHFEDHLNFLIDLTQTEVELWRKMSSTRKQNLHHAEKFQVKIVEAKSERQIKIFYKLLQETYIRAKLPLVNASLFYAIFRILVPRRMAKFFLAEHNRRYISAFLALNYQNRIYNWYAGTDSQKYNLYPNSFLVWEAIKWGQKNHFTIFDFGGAGKPNVPYGPREFKRQFGGELTNFGRLIRVYSPWKYHFAHLGLKVYQWLMSQMRGGK